ncbi:MAG: tetratricopeptide repeat protein [Thermodesulfobacteriota bacterium]
MMVKDNFIDEKMENLGNAEGLPKEIIASDLFPDLAEAFQKQGRIEEAIIICQQGVNLRPDNLRLRLILGKCYLEKGILPEAKEQLERVKEGIEECFSVYKVLSQVYLQEKDVERAMATLKQALTLPLEEDKPQKKLTPLEIDIWQKKIRPLISAPTGEEGKESHLWPLAQEAFQTETMAQIYWKQGRKEKALEIYRELLARDPENKDLRERYSSLEKKWEEEKKLAQRQKVIDQLEKWLATLSLKEK